MVELDSFGPKTVITMKVGRACDHYLVIIIANIVTGLGGGVSISTAESTIHAI